MNDFSSSNSIENFQERFDFILDNFFRATGKLLASKPVISFYQKL